MSNKNDTNEKQNYRIITLETNYGHIQGRLSGIEKKLSNEIPHKIDAVSEKIDEVRKNSDKKIDSIKDKLFYGFLVTIGTIVILQVILKVF